MCHIWLRIMRGIRRRILSRFTALVLILSLLPGSGLSAAQAGYTAQSFYPTPEAAFQAALVEYNARHSTAYTIQLSGQPGNLPGDPPGDLAYATAVSPAAAADPAAFAEAASAANAEPSYFVMLAERQGELGWSALVPGQSPAADYNRLLDSFPETTIDATTKVMLRQAEPAVRQAEPAEAAGSGGVTMQANFTGHKLPYAYGKRGYVTQIDVSPSHISQVDFDIEGLAEQGAVYGSKPGKVVFVKQSSSTTCTYSVPNDCWKKSNMVVIQHGDYEYSWYVHLAYNSVPVSVGQMIDYGTRIGTEGQTGYSFGIHLHYMASTGHTTWTDPNNPNDAPWATGITPVDFDEYHWSSLVATYSYTYKSQNAGNLPAPCPAAGGVLLYRDKAYGCAGQSGMSGYLLHTGLGLQNAPASFNDAASSIRIPAGKSVLLYQNPDRGGGKKCINAPGDEDFGGDTFDASSTSLDNQVSSFEVFPFLNCPQSPAADLTAPSGSLTGPSAGATVGRSVQLAASASDAGSGAPGVQFVRFTATWGGQQRVIAADTTAPYSYSWDLCAAGVPDGQVGLGLVVIDQSWNSYDAPGITVTKSYNCAPPAPSSAWAVTYYNSADLSGAPAWTSSENSPFLFQNWGSSSPGGSVQADGWSASFTRSLDFAAGTYRFHCQASAGCKLLIDGVERVSAWPDATFSGAAWSGTLTAGSHTVEVRYYDGTGAARLEAWWQGPDALPEAAACSTGQWCVDYWGNADLAGAPAIHRDEGETLAHDWGSGGPDPLFPAAPFSSRATRSASFDCGTYAFHATTSGGLRLWVDDVLRLDQWSEPAAATSYTSPAVSFGPDPGTHSFKVESFENSSSASLNLSWEKLSNCAVSYTVDTPPTYYVRPGAAITPSVRVNLTGGYLDPTRGDALAYSSGDKLSAPTLIPVRKLVRSSESYTFDPALGFNMTAPGSDGTYTGKWRVKVGSSLLTPEASISAMVDSISPTVSITGPSGILNSYTINIQVSAADTGSGISHTQVFAGYQETAGGTWAWHSLGWNLDGSNNWGWTWIPSALPDQAKVSFFVQAWDKAGNANGSWTSGSMLDRTPPSAALTPLAATQDSNRFLVQWALSDALSGVDHWDIQVQKNSGAWANWLMNQKGAARSAWFVGEVGARYAFQIRAGDVAGNLGSYASIPETYITPCTPDAFEPDGDKTTARPMAVEGAVEIHTICGLNDEDWYRFEASAGAPLILHTTMLGPSNDTYLTLYGTDGVTKIAENDNISAALPGSSILWTPSTSGTYYVSVRYANLAVPVAGDGVTYTVHIANVRYMPLPIIAR